MERIAKPVFAKDDSEEVFRRIKQRVNITVHEPEPSRRLEITIKAILFPLLYIAAYTTALVYGNTPAVLYTSYFLMDIMLVIIFYQNNWLYGI